MEKDWTLIYTVDQAYKAELIKQDLENEGIESVVMNKHDSITESFGPIEIYVFEADKEKALKLIQNLQF